MESKADYDNSWEEEEQDDEWEDISEDDSEDESKDESEDEWWWDYRMNGFSFEVKCEGNPQVMKQDPGNSKKAEEMKEPEASGGCSWAEESPEKEPDGGFWSFCCFGFCFK